MRDQWTWSGIPGMRFEMQAANAVLVTPWGHGTWGVVPSRTDVLFAEFAQQVHMHMLTCCSFFTVTLTLTLALAPTLTFPLTLTRCTCCSSRARRPTLRRSMGTLALAAPTASLCAASVKPLGGRFCRRAVHRASCTGRVQV